MHVALAIVLGLFAAGLLAWLVHDLVKKRSFSQQAAIALLGVIVSATAAFLPAAWPAPTAPTPEPALPTVEISGPDSAPVGKRTFLTVLSDNAVRAEWSIGGFGPPEPVVVDPLPASHQIYVEPTDRSRIGEAFALAVTVYDAAGRRASAVKRFVVIGE